MMSFPFYCLFVLVVFVRAQAVDFHVGLGTEFPTSIGLEGQLSLRGWYARLYFGGTPESYAVGGATLGENVGLIDHRKSLLIQDLGRGASYSQFGIGHIGWPWENFGLELGVSRLNARNSTSTSNILGIVLDMDFSTWNLGILPLQGSLTATFIQASHDILLTKKWKLVPRFGFFTVTSAAVKLDTPPNLIYDYLSLELQKYADSNIKGVTLPMLGLAAAFSF